MYWIQETDYETLVSCIVKEVNIFEQHHPFVHVNTLRTGPFKLFKRPLQGIF